jgi:imidazolonepropionase
MTTSLLTQIGQLVTNDPERDGLLGIVTDAAVLIEDERIAWVGPSADAPDADVTTDAAGCAVLPGFVDSHTHLIFGGDRAGEFEARMA